MEAFFGRPLSENVEIGALRVLDRAFGNGDETLWEVAIAEGDDVRDVLFVVFRGDAFIPANIVEKHIRATIETFSEDRSVLEQLADMATAPAPDRRPHIRLHIEPGDD